MEEKKEITLETINSNVKTVSIGTALISISILFVLLTVLDIRKQLNK